MSVKDPTFLDHIADARISLDCAREMAKGDPLPPSMGDASRALDSIAIDCANLRATVDGLTAKQRAALIRKVRRALGYTYP